MKSLKDTQRACVRFGYDGYVYKRFAGPMARDRFENEVRVLTYLEARGCDYVPQLVAVCEETMEIAMTNCGTGAPLISDQRLRGMFEDLEKEFGVKHDDPFARNVMYNHRSGGFNVIDFEYATIVETGEGFTIEQEDERKLFGGLN